MDLLTLVGSILSSVGVTLATARFLSKFLLGHWLTKELEKYKNSLQKNLEEHKSHLQKELDAEKAKSARLLEEAKTGWQRELEKDKLDWQGEIQKSVEVYLGEQSAEREYKLEARKRLYNAVGPLKFQLLVASRDLSARIHKFWVRPVRIQH